jgi:hypothetical protein
MRSMTGVALALGLGRLSVLAAAQPQAGTTLDIYIVDTEGGKATPLRRTLR